MNNLQTNLLERFHQIYKKDEHKRLLDFVRTARLPIVIFAICMLVGLYFSYKSITLIAAFSQNSRVPTSYPKEIPTPLKDEPIYIDLSGSVSKPQTYSVSKGTRLFKLIEIAGGLSPEADRSYIQRNYNFSVILNDQQKIHIPSIYEVRDGYFTEKRRLVSLDIASSPDRVMDANDSTSDSASRISLNSANLETLKSLPGVGDVTAQRIIAGRPFDAVSNILDRGIVKKSVYDDIVNMLEL